MTTAALPPDPSAREADAGVWSAFVEAPVIMAAALLALVAIGLPIGTGVDGRTFYWTQLAAPFVFACGTLFIAPLVLLRPPARPLQRLAFVLGALAVAAAPLLLLDSGLAALLDARRWRAGFWCEVAAIGCLAVSSIRRLAALGTPPAGALRSAAAPVDPESVRGAARLGAVTPLLFGAWVLIAWQIGVRALDVPQVLLPAPSAIGQALVASWAVLAGDVAQTVLRAVLTGLALGAGLGLATAIAIDRSPFLQRGLLPLAALASTVPLVGIAPIMVMWFGFDWHSKAAVVVVMTFFPMLVNALAGLRASGRIERDLMRSYGAGYARTLVALRLPVALPFVFSALKIDSTLALIGAIVAEFFGSPTAGLGFRISTEAARLNMGLVWAAIGVAALAGSLLYGVISWCERRATFWHPSIRSAR